MGTLSDIGALPDKKVFCQNFRNKVKQILAEGKGSLLGVPVPLTLPPLPPAAVEAQIKAIDDFPDDFDANFCGPAYDLLKKIDDAIPNNKGKGLVPPIFDPTFPLLPVIKFLLELLAMLGIPDPPAWLMLNIPALAVNTDLPDAITELATNCNPEPLAKIINDTDPSLDPEQVKDKLKTLCPFTIDLTIPSLPIPPDFGINFDINFFPIPLGFVIPDLSFPNINFQWTLVWPSIILDLFMAVFTFKIEIPLPGPDIPAWLKALIEALMLVLIGLIILALAPLLAFLLFVAVVIAIVVLLLAAFIVCIIGFVLGAGLVAWAAAYLLGMLGGE